MRARAISTPSAHTPAGQDPAAADDRHEGGDPHGGHGEWAGLADDAGHCGTSWTGPVLTRAMLEADQARREAAEAEAVAHDRKIVALANARRVEGKPELTAQQRAKMLERIAAERRGKA